MPRLTVTTRSKGGGSLSWPGTRRGLSSGGARRNASRSHRLMRFLRTEPPTLRDTVRPRRLSIGPPSGADARLANCRMSRLPWMRGALPWMRRNSPRARMRQA